MYVFSFCGSITREQLCVEEEDGEGRHLHRARARFFPARRLRPQRRPEPRRAVPLHSGTVPEIQSALVLNVSVPKRASSKLRIFG